MREVQEKTGKVGPMRRLSSMFSRSGPSEPSAASSAAAASRQPRVQETICAPKPMPKRCLNEAGHKAIR
jgi:hypothetical protein